MEEGKQYRMNPEVFRAASTGDLSFFEKDSNSNLLKVTRTPKENTVLHVALQFNQFEAAKKIVSLCRSLVSIKNSKGNTPLHVASRAGTSSIVKLLIDEAKEVDVEVGGQQQLLSMVNQDSDTALHVAVRYGNFEVVKELINENDPAGLAKKVNNDGESALFLAVDRQHYDITLHIQRNAPDCSYAGRHGTNVLHALAFRKNSWLKVVQMRNFHMLKNNPRGFMKEVMRKYPFAIEQPDNFGWTPLEIAAFTGFMKEVMRKCPFAIEKPDNFGWTPLEIAAFIGNEKFVKLLLDVLEKDQTFNNAYSKNKDDFLEKDQKFNMAYSKNNEGLSALHIAYSKNNEGLSALHIAAKEGNVKVMKVLINKCQDIYELLDNKGRNALHVAAESGQSAAVNFFLDRLGFNGLINEQDKEGNTPMHLAAIKEHFEIASQLLEHGKGVDLNSTNNDGLTTMDNLMLLGFRLTRVLRLKLKDAQQSLRGALADPEVPADKSISDSKADGMENSNSKADGMKKSDTKAEIMMDSDSIADGMKNSDTKAGSMMDSNTKADVMKISNSKADSMKNSDSKEDSIMTMNQTSMLVATLITTVTFAAAFTVPGGYRSQGVDEGKAVLSETKAFRVFQVANACAFGLSISSVYLNYAVMTFKSLPEPSDQERLSIALTTYSILLLLVAFVSGTYTVVPRSMGMTLAVIVSCCFFIWTIMSLLERFTRTWHHKMLSFESDEEY